ncbi:DUF6233 domain-containing protein [Streptomyces sp. NPDC048288]|uniref:DUF6233 domain-containing protein n=1 Tax=Streptomyces sp. NPDC048288 TaxID=3365529 RepID=UPI00371FFB92
MSEMLPPDPARLRVILAHLDQQMTDHEIVGTYLRLQHDAVRAALARAERRAIPRPVISAPKRPPGDRRDPGADRRTHGRPPGSFIAERTAKASTAALIHTSNCAKGFTSGRPIEAGLARQVLVNDPRGFQACDTCRPDTELGIDVA